MALRLDNVLNTMSSALTAESIRLNTTASNLANAGNVGKTSESTYRAKHPVFEEIVQQIKGVYGNQPSGGVQVKNIATSDKPLEWRFEPDNPMADENGHVYMTDVNPMEEMMNMVSASKQYQSNVEVINTTKKMLQQTIKAMNS